MNTPSAGNSTEHAERFTLLRPLLFTIAYEILGTTTESDDVLQESYLRWAEVDLDTVRDTKAFLAQLVTRQALNALRAQSRRREDYVGPWLPEPLLLAAGEAGDPSSDLVLAESVSMAMLVVLETLTPDERAVFVLREVFGFSHDEIASAIGKSASAVRQMAHRAREHVQSRRKRFEPVDQQVSTEVTQRFFAAAATGDMNVLLELLAPDVVWTADSDGKRSAARRPVTGAQSVARLVMGLMRFTAQGGRFEPTTYNSAPAFKLYLEDSFEGVITVEVVDGKITHFYAMRNPDKLTGIDIPRVISR
ncbi:RNA polymerase sigma-70 factor (ECF subfamily) [Mycobacterium frederiksbergense]|uniref:RNA polymerase sigma-70 factor (ECF subfamily) n=1 Tax=Mycolicibacterium frederiksbergense TaxID=117567 RepID=A0ABT6L7F9_9MYCO|nr:RNA polymerase sigma factor SigJ [Mycolicibacterium frederiksbergense]MDH6198893.1 RNA polymerase sigma-70 factor (ECF subfamily) [Mycolicibacterium frederiksbergense]